MVTVAPVGDPQDPATIGGQFERLAIVAACVREVRADQDVFEHAQRRCDLEASVLGVGRREVRGRARWQRDHAGVDHPHVANVNAERLRDPPALDSVGAGENAQELLPRQVGKRGCEPIIEAALLGLGHDAGQVEELPSRGRDAAVLVSDRASNHCEQHVPDVEHPIALHRAEAPGFEQQCIAIEQPREDGHQRGNYGRGLRVVWCRHRQPHPATRSARFNPPEITPFLTDCRWSHRKYDDARGSHCSRRS